LRWVIVTSRPSLILLLLASVGRIWLLLRNVHERRETRLVLGRINIVSHGKISHFIRLRWINSWPLRGGKQFVLVEGKKLTLGEDNIVVLEDPNWDSGQRIKVVQNVIQKD
jgi:hypothetical protein